jgi:hypothetical protein
MKRFILHRYWPVYVLSGFYLALGGILRLVLWWAYGREGEVGPAELPRILGAGLVNDAVQSLYFLATSCCCPTTGSARTSIAGS